jgi:hypothetical protein
VYGQVEGPPSLLLGLSGLTGERGTIDVALLSEIIADKQSELKKEILKREVYEKLEYKSYVIWEYAYNSLEILLNSKSKQSIEKELLRYAADMALVYSFTETYLQVSNRLCNSDLKAVVEAWDTSAKDTLAAYFVCPSPGKILKNRFWLSALKEKNDQGLNIVLLDLVFDILRQNATLKSLGFYQSQLPLGEEFYKTHNKYLNTKGDLRKALDALRVRMEGEVSVLIDNYYVIQLAVEKRVSIQDFSTLVEKEKKSKVNLDTLFMDLAAISKSPGVASDENLSDRIADALDAFIDLRKRNVYQVNDLYYLQEKTFPLVVKLVTQYNFDPKYLKLVEEFKTVVLSQLLADIVKKLDQVYNPSKPENATKDNRSIVRELNAIDYQQFVEILSHIFELDKASTYQDYLETLRSISVVFSDQNLARLIYTITDNLEKFTVLDKEKNAIRIDVEEIILQLYNKYEARTSSRVNFYFSIGLNQVFSTHYKKGYELREDSAQSINSIAFAAEKIGVKFKLYDWRKRNSFDYGETFQNRKVTSFRSRAPIVSDVYLLLYGSGLLYNITNTTTSKNFDHPIIGTGLGIAFFNSLDFNLFVNSPLLSNESLTKSLGRRQWFGFSFDIKIGDYITRVRQKRLEKKSDSNN